MELSNIETNEGRIFEHMFELCRMECNRMFKLSTTLKIKHTFGNTHVFNLLY